MIPAPGYIRAILWTEWKLLHTREGRIFS